MPQQLIHYDPAPALAEARAIVARLKEPGAEFFGQAPLHRQGGHRVLREMLKRYALSHPLNMTHVCALARAGAEEAELALVELIAEFADRGEPRGAVLEAFNLELLHPRATRRPRGKKKVTHWLQDICILVTVLQVAERCGLKPTRRRQSPRPSACSIAAQALAEAGIHRGGEAGIEKIWQRLAPVAL